MELFEWGQVKVLSKIRATKIQDSSQGKLQKRMEKNKMAEKEPAGDPGSGHVASPDFDLSLSDSHLRLVVSFSVSNHACGSDRF